MKAFCCSCLDRQSCDLITPCLFISPVQHGTVIFLPQPPGAGITSVGQQAGLHVCPHIGLLSFSPEHLPFSFSCVYGPAHACVGVVGCTGVCGYVGGASVLWEHTWRSEDNLWESVLSSHDGVSLAGLFYQPSGFLPPAGDRVSLHSPGEPRTQVLWETSTCS